MSTPPRLSPEKARIAARGAAEARRHRRVDVTLDCHVRPGQGGRRPCRLENVSAGGARMVGQFRPDAGERIHFDIESLGYLEAEVVRTDDEGAYVRWVAGPRRRERITELLTWRWNAERLGLEEDAHGRRKATKGYARVRLDAGGTIVAEVVDISRSGLHLRSERRPALGARVTVGRLTGAVARFTTQGFAVQFDAPLAPRPKPEQPEEDAGEAKEAEEATDAPATPPPSAQGNDAAGDENERDSDAA